VSGGWDGEDIRIPVVFEPTEIGVVQDTLVVSSPEGGEYICELIAACVAPMPQGPFNLVQGTGAIDVPFRNCFTTSCNWAFSVDSTAFRVVSPTATVAAKTLGNCSVVFEPSPDQMNTPSGYINAKLFVACTNKPDVPAWIFYLRGKIDKNAPPPGAPGKKK